jgi:proline iminopeptidase
VAEARAREERVPVPGGALWTATSGRGIPLLLCHGGPGGYDDLAALAALVDDVALVHRFDQRGGGRSARAAPWTVGALVDDMEALRRHWGHERWIVAGHSWGAHLALFWALAHPGRASGLAFLDGPGVRWGWGPARRARRLPRLTARERDEVAALEAVVSRGPAPEARARLRDLWWRSDFARREQADRHGRPARYEPDDAVTGALEDDWRSRLEGIDDELRGLDVPALVLHGEEDPIGEAGPREVADLLPRGRFAAIPGAGHVPWLEDAAAVAGALRGFVAGLSSPPAGSRG